MRRPSLGNGSRHLAPNLRAKKTEQVSKSVHNGRGQLGLKNNHRQNAGHQEVSEGGIATFFLDQPVKQSSHAPKSRTSRARRHLLLSSYFQATYESSVLAGQRSDDKNRRIQHFCVGAGTAMFEG